MTPEDFLLWEARSRDHIDLKRIYVDIAGDLATGVLLSQILYWHLPDRTGATKLRVKSGPHLWIAKTRAGWWDECRLTPKQFDRSCQVLEGKKLIATTLLKFNGAPTKHIRLCVTNLIAAVQGVKSISPFGEYGNEPLGNMEMNLRGISYSTEITTETTTESLIASVDATKPSKRKATKPSLEERNEYGKQIGMASDDIEAFFDHFESNGWQVGRTTMKDWKAAMRTWNRNGARFGRKPKVTPAPRHPVGEEPPVLSNWV